MLLLIFFRLINFSYGCQIDSSIGESLEKNPLSARSIAIGRIEEEKVGNEKASFLKVEYSYGKIIPKIKFKSSILDYCDRPPAVNKMRYLLLSSFNLEKKYPPAGLGNHDNFVIEISEAKKILVKVAGLKPLSKEEINPAWKFCKKDNDCSTVNFCGKDFNVNTEFENYYLPYLKSVGCVDQIKTNVIHRISKCVDNLCAE